MSYAKQGENTKKEQMAKICLEFLSNNENPFAKWNYLSTEVCGYENEQQLYQILTPKERKLIESEALANRRLGYTRMLAGVDQALLKSAIKGNSNSARLAYAKFEGWSETVNQKIEQEIVVKFEFDTEFDDKLKKDKDAKGNNPMPCESSETPQPAMADNRLQSETEDN